MQHLAWFLELKRAKATEKRCEVTLLNADQGLNKDVVT